MGCLALAHQADCRSIRNEPAGDRHVARASFGWFDFTGADESVIGAERDIFVEVNAGVGELDCESIRLA